MARAKEPEVATGFGEGLRRYEPPAMISRPCPLCAAPIPLSDEPGPQEVCCKSCGLHCVLEAPARPAPPPVAQAPPLDPDSAALIQWLEREPRPLQPSSEPAPEVVQARKRVRRISLAALAAIIAAIAVSGQVAARRADQRIARQRQIESQRASQQKAISQSEQARLLRQTEAEQARRLAAERQTRLVNAKYVAHRAVTAAKANPWRAVAFATQAINATFEADNYITPEAHQSLRDALFACSDSHSIDGIVLDGHSNPVTAIATSANGRWLASGSHDSLRVWDLCASDPRHASKVLIKHDARVGHLLFTSDNGWLIAGSEDSSTRLWDMANLSDGAAPIVLPGKQSPIQSMAVSPNGRWLATIFQSYGDDLGTARLWDLADGPRAAVSLELSGQGRRIQAVAISPDSRWLALGVGETVRMWDLHSRVPAIASLARQCQHGNVTKTMFTADQRWLLTSGGSSTERGIAVQMWSLTVDDPSTSVVLQGHQRPIKCIATSADSRWLVTIGEDGFVKAWDLQSSNPALAAATVSLGKSSSTAAAISSDGRWLAVSTEAGKVYLWNMVDQGPASPPIILHSGDNRLLSLAFSADAHWLAAGGADRKIRLWNLDLRELVAQASAIAYAKSQAITKRFPWLTQPDATVQQLLVAPKRFAATGSQDLSDRAAELKLKSLTWAADARQRVLRWISQPGIAGLPAGLIRKPQPAPIAEPPVNRVFTSDSAPADASSASDAFSATSSHAAEPHVTANATPAAPHKDRRPSPYERLPHPVDAPGIAASTNTTLRINPR